MNETGQSDICGENDSPTEISVSKIPSEPDAACLSPDAAIVPSKGSLVCSRAIGKTLTLLRTASLAFAAMPPMTPYEYVFVRTPRPFDRFLPRHVYGGKPLQVADKTEDGHDVLSDSRGRRYWRDSKGCIRRL